MNELSNKLEAIREGISNAYDAVEAKGGTLPTTQDLAHLATAVQSVPSGASVWNGVSPTPTYSAMDMLMQNYISQMLEYTDTHTTTFTRAYTFYFLNQFRKMTFTELLNVGNYTSPATWNACYNLEELVLPKITNVRGSTFNGCSKLKKLYMPSLTSQSGTAIYNGCMNLIDITLGTMSGGSFTLATWNPTNALSSTSSSLVDEGETFANNLEKLLYNIREHIAANLEDRTGLSSYTVTFVAAVKTAINNDEATKNAFINKGWTIA